MAMSKQRHALPACFEIGSRKFDAMRPTQASPRTNRRDTTLNSRSCLQCDNEIETGIFLYKLHYI